LELINVNTHANILIVLPLHGILLLLLFLGKEPVPLPPLAVLWNRGLGISNDGTVSVIEEETHGIRKEYGKDSHTHQRDVSPGGTHPDPV
jgi:hypothetical protein